MSHCHLTVGRNLGSSRSCYFAKSLSDIAKLPAPFHDKAATSVGPASLQMSGCCQETPTRPRPLCPRASCRPVRALPGGTFRLRLANSLNKGRNGRNQSSSACQFVDAASGADQPPPDKKHAENVLHARQSQKKANARAGRMLQQSHDTSRTGPVL